MLWDVIFGGFAGLSAVLGLWQWIAALRFPLHHRKSASGPSPGVAILKPLKGCDEFTEKCLRSWLQQDYPGPVQILFGVASEEDPVGDCVLKLLEEFPDTDASLEVCAEDLGANAKVSKLIQLQRRAKHDVVVVSDADVLVPPDLLVSAVEPLVEDPSEQRGIGSSSASLEAENRWTDKDDGRGRRTRPSANNVGLVSCIYRLADPSTLAMQWEAVAVNADFWSQVLQANTLKPMDFALGAVMVVRKEALEGIGGFEALSNCLADDYQLGNRIVRQGYRAELCPVVVGCWDPPQGWGAVWKHQLRWARTVRVCQPLPYFFSILSNATFWPLMWLLLVPSTVSMIGSGVLVVLRIALAFQLQRRLTPGGFHPAFFWMVPVKDLLGAGIWLAAFLGNTIEWRGRRMRLRPDGTLVPPPPGGDADGR